MQELVKAAALAREYAYGPYSRFKVGAAVLGGSGRVYTGCNIENASYGLTICAERAAIFKAISEGEKELVALAVVADTQQPASPCGACRQVMVEFGVETVVLGNLKGEQMVCKLDKLLPYSFTKQAFKGDEALDE